MYGCGFECKPAVEDGRSAIYRSYALDEKKVCVAFHDFLHLKAPMIIIVIDFQLAQKSRLKSGTQEGSDLFSRIHSSAPVGDRQMNL